MALLGPSSVQQITFHTTKPCKDGRGLGEEEKEEEVHVQDIEEGSYYSEDRVRAQGTGGALRKRRRRVMRWEKGALYWEDGGG